MKSLALAALFGVALATPAQAQTKVSIGISG